jgi:hypothetical protein
MTSFDKPDYLSPDDPLYYAPRRLRQASDRPSAPDVVPNDVAAASRRHLMQPELVPAPPPGGLRRLMGENRLGVIGGIAVAVVLAVFAAVVVTIMTPVAQPPGEANAAAPSFLGVLQSRGLPATAAPASDSGKAAADDADGAAAPVVAPASEPAAKPDDSDALLRQLMQWDKNSAAKPAP